MPKECLFLGVRHLNSHSPFYQPAGLRYYLHNLVVEIPQQICRIVEVTDRIDLAYTGHKIYKIIFIYESIVLMKKHNPTFNLNGEKRERGRPSKIAAAARARLLGPPDEIISISLMQSTNYDEFIIPTGVFEHSEEEVRQFAERVSMRNELLWNPIRVTPYMEVYDGKLRLAAARYLNCPLAYVIDETLSVGHIIADRGEPRGWAFDQYCVYYAEQGRPEYLKVLAFAKTHDIPLGSAASLLQGGGITGTEAALNEFKFGRFQVTHEAHARQVVGVRDEYRRKLPKMRIKPKKDITRQRVFLNAVSKQLALPGKDPDALCSILALIRWQPTEADYDRHLACLTKKQK